MLFYYDANAEETPDMLADNLSRLLSSANIGNRPLIILCIGSDRSTGDSLGPLIGYKLSKMNLENVTVFGSLAAPIHAVNLEATLELIDARYHHPYIIAIDASLGKRSHIGYITLGTGALTPGLGVKKELPEVGDLHITGIVNFSGVMDTLLLQTTRLSTIMTLADAIAEGLRNTFAKELATYA